MTKQIEKQHIPMNRFGKEHWSTFAYAETCCVDHGGQLEIRKLTTDGDKYPSRIKDGVEVKGHSEIDCLEDLEREDLIIIVSMANLCVQLTKKGYKASAKLREHKMHGANYASFEYIEE